MFFLCPFDSTKFLSVKSTITLLTAPSDIPVKVLISLIVLDIRFLSFRKCAINSIDVLEAKRFPEELLTYNLNLKKNYITGKISCSRYIQILYLKRDGRNIQEWIKYYDLGYTTIVSHVLDLTEELRNLNKKLNDAVGLNISANFYFYFIGI